MNISLRLWIVLVSTWLLACRGREFVYYPAAPENKEGLGYVLVNTPVEGIPSYPRGGMYCVVVATGGYPTPFSGLARRMALEEGRHDLVVALLSGLQYEPTQQDVPMFSFDFAILREQELALRSRLVGGLVAECFLEDQHGVASFQGKRLSDAEAALVSKAYELLDAFGVVGQGHGQGHGKK